MKKIKYTLTLVSLVLFLAIIFTGETKAALVLNDQNTLSEVNKEYFGVIKNMRRAIILADTLHCDQTDQWKYVSLISPQFNSSNVCGSRTIEFWLENHGIPAGEEVMITRGHKPECLGVGAPKLTKGFERMILAYNDGSDANKKRASNNFNIALAPYSNQIRVRFSQGRGKSTSIYSVSPINVGRPYHIAVILNAEDNTPKEKQGLYIYINGRIDNFVSIKLQNICSDIVGSLSIGSDRSAIFITIDDLRISKTARYTNVTYKTPTKSFKTDRKIIALYNFDGDIGDLEVVNDENIKKELSLWREAQEIVDSGKSISLQPLLEGKDVMGTSGIPTRAETVRALTKYSGGGTDLSYKNFAGLSEEEKGRDWISLMLDKSQLISVGHSSDNAHMSNLMTQPIMWVSEHFTIMADNFYMYQDKKLYCVNPLKGKTINKPGGSYYVPPDECDEMITDVSATSDPFTFEASWGKGGQGGKLTMHFDTDQKKWWADKIITSNGQNEIDYIEDVKRIGAEINKNFKGNIAFSSTENSIHFDNLELISHSFYCLKTSHVNPWSWHMDHPSDRSFLLDSETGKWYKFMDAPRHLQIASNKRRDEEYRNKGIYEIVCGEGITIRKNEASPTIADATPTDAISPIPSLSPTLIVQPEDEIEKDEFNICNQISDSILREKCNNCQDIDGLWTAFGCIPTNLNSIISAIITIGLMSAGGVTLLIILVSGFLLSTSKGNSDQVSKAGKLLVSAIIGLLFAIFSVSILRFIGYSVLRIPGLGS